MTTNSVRQSRVNQRWRLNRLLFKSCFPKKQQKKQRIFHNFFSGNKLYACMTTNSVRQSRVNQRWRLNRLLFKSCFSKNNKKQRIFHKNFSGNKLYARMTTNSVRQSRVNQRWRLNHLLSNYVFKKKHGNLVYIFSLSKKKVCKLRKQRSVTSCILHAMHETHLFCSSFHDDHKSTCSANDSVSTYDVVSMKKLLSEENNVQSASLDSHGETEHDHQQCHNKS